MRYEGTVYRPPSEAGSLIIQLTIGCARNTCTFCNMYKDKNFRIRPLSEVVEDLEAARRYYGFDIERIFLADGDALIVKTEDLLFIIGRIKEIFPEVKRISIYATPKDILDKTSEDLKKLKESGLDMLYIGAESGDDEVLKHVKKGVTRKEIIDACLKAKEAGFILSITLISGLGGSARVTEHAINSATLISKINPEYVGLLTLMIEPEVPLYEELQSGSFKLLSPSEVLTELELFLKNIDAEGTVFRSNHASNYLPLKGTFNKDIGQLLRQIEYARENKLFRPEGYRGI